MDWGKAKSILILSFLFLNLLLGYQLWTTYYEQTHAETDTTLIVEETNKLLSEKRIQLQADVPKDMPKLRSFTVRFLGEQQEDVVPLSPPVKLANVLSRNFAKELAAKTPVKNASDYALDNVRTQDGVYVFNQVIDKVPMFDVNLILYEKKGEFVGYKQAYVEVQSGGEQKEQKEQKVISAYTAIRSLAETYLEEGSVIKDVRLGYHGQSFDSETRYMLPFWRITPAEGTPFYVQAYIGEVESVQLPPEP
ncbi:hypothetical protein J31TS4_38840 [Paenibacillus sp. J31TS4]|uniref:two-component system regulatory protein YycI n=1 Tax=Paenibacillus sp. J31TS4 TaxID=2807195 RepID=UPI001B2BB877|nr:two-component system regulatory protein YycI [Paenibacillus sp. J31TS4]GIP40604.1 hypothetical protein J31TS4_38840 [Paenibacillus sp. J31TS4]